MDGVMLFKVCFYHSNTDM